MPVTETELLGSADLTAAIPCAIWLRGGFRRCGKPSAWRIRSTCPGCGRNSILFACQPCVTDIAAGGGICAGCWTVRGIDGYL